METKNKKRYYILGIIAIILLAVLIVPNFFVSYIQEITKELNPKLTQGSSQSPSAVDSTSWRWFSW